MTTILTTTERGDGTVYASRYAGEFDLITCIGGDGTFNEVVAGLLDGGEGTGRLYTGRKHQRLCKQP